MCVFFWSQKTTLFLYARVDAKSTPLDYAALHAQFPNPTLVDAADVKAVRAWKDVRLLLKNGSLRR